MAPVGAAGVGGGRARPDAVAVIDVGGTILKGALIDANGSILQLTQTPTPRGVEAVVAAVRAGVGELIAGPARVRAVGIAVPGDVDAEVGIARYSANLGWRDLPVGAFAAGILDAGIPLVLDHDVRCAARAEATVGATRGVAESCLIVIGTGIAAVSSVGGVVVRGAGGIAGELGHVVVWPDGEQCACGQRGCLETYASAGAIARRYEAATGVARPTHEVVASVSSDLAARRVWAEAIDALALGCIAVTMLNDPAVIAFAGGLAEAGDALVRPLREAMAARLTWRPAPQLAVSPLGGQAGRYGIALRAWEAAGVTVDAQAWVGVLG